MPPCLSPGPAVDMCLVSDQISQDRSLSWLDSCSLGFLCFVIFSCGFSLIMFYGSSSGLGACFCRADVAAAFCRRGSRAWASLPGRHFRVHRPESVRLPACLGSPGPSLGGLWFLDLLPPSWGHTQAWPRASCGAFSQLPHTGPQAPSPCLGPSWVCCPGGLSQRSNKRWLTR